MIASKKRIWIETTRGVKKRIRLTYKALLKEAGGDKGLAYKVWNNPRTEGLTVVKGSRLEGRVG